jgi:hypothetical protein
MRVLLIEDDRATAHAIELMLKLENSIAALPISAKKVSISARNT